MLGLFDPGDGRIGELPSELRCARCMVRSMLMERGVLREGSIMGSVPLRESILRPGVSSSSLNVLVMDDERARIR